MKAKDLIDQLSKLPPDTQVKGLRNLDSDREQVLELSKVYDPAPTGRRGEVFILQTAVWEG